ncbi:hypothetical protein GUJ93_ZPchr0002g23256 [Zizania palustris]|uniref:Leucine-rich repeat-containing N-terminal plant-type domain-containing protein n=1 Tax=Zizania palustris TaxID=103762 RepID=A0A8J5VG30_ZIZPA|nr:hypothetical protein GUJ93_ZPchr0002g23256 [Zizania palustris]
MVMPPPPPRECAESRYAHPRTPSMDHGALSSNLRDMSGGRAKTLVLPQGFGRHAGVSSLAVRAKESDDFSALASEKPAEPAPAKREAWKGFGREMSNGDDEVQMQGESASWNVLNHIGVELSSMGLNGTLGYQLSNLQALKTMDLSSNNLHDSIPYQLPPNLTYL